MIFRKISDNKMANVHAIHIMKETIEVKKVGDNEGKLITDLHWVRVRVLVDGLNTKMLPCLVLLS